MTKKIHYIKGDIIGKNGLIFIEDIDSYVNPFTKNKLRMALFECGKCHKQFKAIIGNVKKGTTRSCGCYKINLQTKHRLGNQRTYRIWNHIIQRCENPNDKGYINYGGRGISVYITWRLNFVVFHNYIISLPNYNDNNRLLDRINNDGNYEPGNLRWADYYTSCINRRMPKHNTSGYIGVSYCKKDKAFVSTITINKKQIHIKNSKDPKIAALARDEYIRKNNLTLYKLNNVTL